MLDIQRTNEKGKIEHLLARKLIQPYIYKVVKLTGKVRFGETIIETAKRELMEETGLTSESFNLKGIYRKIRKREDGKTVQDVIFYRVAVNQLSGSLIKKTPYQENFWTTTENAFNNPKIDLIDDMNLKSYEEDIKFKYSENIDIAEGF